MRQFNVNTQFNGSWALYSSDKTTPLGGSAGDGPYAFSGKKFSNEKQDGAILSTLKKWAAGFFAQNAVCDLGKCTQLKSALKKEGDFDVCAKIL